MPAPEARAEPAERDPGSWPALWGWFWRVCVHACVCVRMCVLGPPVLDPVGCLPVSFTESLSWAHKAGDTVTNVGICMRHVADRGVGMCLQVCVHVHVWEGFRREPPLLCDVGTALTHTWLRSIWPQVRL